MLLLPGLLGSRWRCWRLYLSHGWRTCLFIDAIYFDRIKLVVLIILTCSNGWYFRTLILEFKRNRCTIYASCNTKYITSWFFLFMLNELISSATFIGVHFVLIGLLLHHSILASLHRLVWLRNTASVAGYADRAWYISSCFHRRSCRCHGWWDWGWVEQRALLENFSCLPVHIRILSVFMLLRILIIHGWM